MLSWPSIAYHLWYMVWTTCISAFYNFGINGYCVDLCKRFSRQNIITDGIIQKTAPPVSFSSYRFHPPFAVWKSRTHCPPTETVCAYRFRKNSCMVICRFAWMPSGLTDNWTLSISLIQFSISKLDNRIYFHMFIYSILWLLEAGCLGLIVQLAINTIWNNNNTERME